MEKGTGYYLEALMTIEKKDVVLSKTTSNDSYAMYVMLLDMFIDFL